MPPDPPRPATPVDGIMVVQVLDGRTVDLYDAPEGNIAATQGDETEFGSPSVFWVRRRTGRWFGVSSPEVPNSELAWIRADPRTLSAKFIRHSMVVDLSARTAHLFQGHRQIRSWPITVGAPGTETPTGRFAITDTLRGDLSPAYGCCALALSATQPKLPSDWSGGDRIAFHGTSGPLGIAASTGCIRSPDSVLKTLLEEVELGTPVVIRD